MTKAKVKASKKKIRETLVSAGFDPKTLDVIEKQIAADEKRRKRLGTTVVEITYNSPLGIDPRLDEKAHRIATKFKAKDYASGCTMFGQPQRDIAWDVPISQAAACSAALKKAGFTIFRDGSEAND